MANVSYDYYRIFYYVGKYKSFSMAAKMLESNQPNVTKVMNKLEQQLGCSLFLRSNRGITLTPAGELLYGRVKIAYEQLSRAEDELRRDAGLEGGIVQIASCEMALYGVLLEALHSFHKEYPTVRLTLSHCSTPQAVQALKQGMADFCVLTTPIETGKKLRLTGILQFSPILVASEDFIRAEKKTSFSVEEVVNYPLVSLAEGTGTFQYFTDFFANYGLPFAPDIQTAASAQLMPLIEKNLGIGFVPEFMAAERLQKGTLRQLEFQAELPKREICLVERVDQHLSPAAQAMKQAVLAQRRA